MLNTRFSRSYAPLPLASPCRPPSLRGWGGGRSGEFISSLQPPSMGLSPTTPHVRLNIHTTPRSSRQFILMIFKGFLSFSFSVWQIQKLLMSECCQLPTHTPSIPKGNFISAYSLSSPSPQPIPPTTSSTSFQPGLFPHWGNRESEKELGGSKKKQESENRGEWRKVEIQGFWFGKQFSWRWGIRGTASGMRVKM